MSRSTLAARYTNRARTKLARIFTATAVAALLSAVFAAGAQAHTVAATATCTSVTFHWTSFASSGNGNGGRNTPTWKIVFTPAAAAAARAAAAAAAAPTTLAGQVSFTGRSHSLTVTLPSGNGVAAASSSWTAAQTRDGHSASWAKNLTIANCPPPPATPPVTPPAPPAATVKATPALGTTASADVALGGSIHDTAVLSGGSSPTGTITFNLYSASDTTCATPLGTSTVPVNGAGSYDSAPVTPPTAGSYQWVATYSGDANNTGVSGACNDPAEQATVAVTVVKASCVASPVVLRGMGARVHRRLTVSVRAAAGIQSVTFYLDGRRLATVSKPRNKRFSLTIDARPLRYGMHRVGARAKTADARCTRAAAAGQFVKVRAPTIVPKFTG